jgi:hypothetical protein
VLCDGGLGHLSCEEGSPRCKRPNGKRPRHKCRIPATALAESDSKLQKATAELQACQTFDKLCELVRRKIGGIWGVGVLTVYDVATRIGARMDLGKKVSPAMAAGLTGSLWTIESLLRAAA